MKNRIIIITFITILITPLVVQITGFERVILRESNIELKTPPVVEFEDFIRSLKKVKSFYSSNFGLKTTFFELYKKFVRDVFKDDPLPNKVITGSNGWLFLGDLDSDAVSESLGFINFSLSELNLISDQVRNQKKWLNENGIKYYIAIAPSKHTLYKKHLPFKTVQKETKIDVLKAYLKDHIGFELIDMKSYMYAKKDSLNLFFQHDTHWNDVGAFLAYEKLIDVISNDFSILESQRLMKSEIVVDSVSLVIGDLNLLLNESVREKRVSLKKTGGSKVAKVQDMLIPPSNYNRDFDMYENRYIKSSNKLKILIFRDSFSTALIKYISETFGESVYIWHHYFNKELIIKENPDIVLFELGERVIEKLKGVEK